MSFENIKWVPSLAGDLGRVDKERIAGGDWSSSTVWT